MTKLGPSGCSRSCRSRNLSCGTAHPSYDGLKIYAREVIEALVDAQLLETEDGRYFRFHDLIRLCRRTRERSRR